MDSGRRDHLHFHLDREVMLVFHEFTKRVKDGAFQLDSAVEYVRKNLREKDSLIVKVTDFLRKTAYKPI